MKRELMSDHGNGLFLAILLGMGLLIGAAVGVYKIAHAAETGSATSTIAEVAAQTD